jgi:hypothetical protein
VSEHNRYLKALPLASVGLSAAGLGVSTANFLNAKASRESQERQRKLEAQSLGALKAIHGTLSGETK